MAETVSIPGVFGHLREQSSARTSRPRPSVARLRHLPPVEIVLPLEVFYAQQHTNGVWQSTAVRSGATLT